MLKLLVNPHTHTHTRHTFPFAVLRKGERRCVWDFFGHGDDCVSEKETERRFTPDKDLYTLSTYSWSSLIRAVCCSFSWVATIRASSLAASSCLAFSASSLPTWVRYGSVRKWSILNLFECTSCYLILGQYTTEHGSYLHLRIAGMHKSFISEFA